MVLYVIEYLAHGTTWTPSNATTTNPLAIVDYLRGIQEREGYDHHRIAEYHRFESLAPVAQR